MTRVRLFSEPGSEAQTFLQFRQQASKSSDASSQRFQIAGSMGFQGEFRKEPISAERPQCPISRELTCCSYFKLLETDAFHSFKA